MSVAKKQKIVVLGVTGSIAAFKAAELASALFQKGLAVRVIMTKEAEHFITPLSMQILSRHKVYRGMFEAADTWDIDHVSLADQADLILIAPATAHVIAKLAWGLCDDLLSCTATASRAKVLIAPAMNDGMYLNQAVQRNIETLRKMGHRFIGPKKGLLACGREATGCMSDVGDIVSQALALL